MILGLASLIPDIDLAIYWILHWFGFTLEEVHRTFSHNIFIPLAFFLLALVTIKFKNRELGKHHLKIHLIFLMIAIGILTHLVLDASIGGNIMPFYPLSNMALGEDISAGLPEPLDRIFWPCLDAALLVLWIVYMEWKHKISDFI